MDYQTPPRIFPFRWIFPLGQLVLCVLAISIVMPSPGVIPYRYAERILEAIAAINLPGALMQFPVALVRADHGTWRPFWIPFYLWRAISWPIGAMVFWWIAGRATEALVALNYRQIRPKINWVETITGFLIMAAGATFMGGMLFGLSASERDWQSTRLAAAGGLWALLGALSVIARFRQTRLRKKMSILPAAGPTPAPGA